MKTPRKSLDRPRARRRNTLRFSRSKFLAPAILLLCAHPLYADSPQRLIAKGNAAYHAGEYDKALSHYEEASVDTPESPYIYFNQGAAYYQMGDLAKAKEGFEKAAVKTRDTDLEVHAKFNLGNTAFREAERQQDSDLEKSLAACEQSIRHYQDSLKLDPGFKQAAENIEVVRLTMKAILDEIKKRQEEAKQQQQDQEKLKELIEQQEQLLEQSTALGDKADQTGEQAVEQASKELAAAQRDLEQETRELAEQMQQDPAAPNQTMSPQQPDPPQAARRQIEQAISQQQQAADGLDQVRPKDAAGHEEKAIEHLKQALASTGDGQEQQQESQQEKQQSEDGQQQQSQPQPQEQQQEQPDEQQQAQLNEQAHDILDEEKKNREQRQQPAAGNYRPVAKDW